MASKKVKTNARILIWDIETSPIEGKVWGLYDQTLGLNQINSDWSILSFCCKWYGEKKVHYFDTSKQKNLRDDKELVKKLWDFLDEADIVISQNGTSFDSKKVKARMIMHGMKPPSSYREIDTLRIAKKHFGFTSNKLAYLTANLCTKKKKLSHAQFPGMSLWIEYLKGNKKAFKEMKEYNIMDVLALEELYEILIPWDNRINFSAYIDGGEDVCSCGSTHFQKNGMYYTNSSKVQRYRCVECGSEKRGRTNLLSKDKRKGMLR